MGGSRPDLTRRAVLGGLAATGMGAFGAGCTDRSRSAPTSTRAVSTTTVPRPTTTLPPGTRPAMGTPEGIDTLPQVEHVVIYMQENHSFDNYFGMLGRGDGFTLRGGRPTNSNPGPDGKPVTVAHSNAFCDRTEQASQTWSATHRSVNGGKMDGFVTAADGGTGSMAYFDGGDLPFYWSLARTFPLCDRWFASAPCQTLPNRRFLQAGTAVGMISSDPLEVLKAPEAPNGIIWERLEAHGISWANYAVDLPDILLFPKFYESHKDRIRSFDDFLRDAAAGTLPQVCLISPGHRTWTEENPSDIQLGELYSWSIMQALMHGPGWERTALLFMYDEHGGYYDHVPPPRAIPPDDIAPMIDPASDPAGGYDVYGVRVPAMVISPFSRRNHVSSIVRDHTSVLKFIETKFNLGALTYRDANADDLMDCFDFDTAAFREPPELTPPALADRASTCEPATPKPPMPSVG